MEQIENRTNEPILTHGLLHRWFWKKNDHLLEQENIRLIV